MLFPWIISLSQYFRDEKLAEATCLYNGHQVLSTLNIKFIGSL